LGLFGKFRRAAGRSGAIRWKIASATQAYELSGPTACEVLSPPQLESLLARLGPDVLRADAKSAVAFARMQSSRRALGALLLDQSVISGVGNVYRAEALFISGLHPSIRGVDLTSSDFRRLWKCLVGLLKAGVADRRIDTVGHETNRKSKRGERTYVYKQKSCRRCSEPVETLTMAGRKMYLCENCQRR
jgi:endonuclease VIII